MTFEEFVEQRDEQRAALNRVTWRRVSPDTGGGYSGIGAGGKLVFVVREGAPAARARGRDGWLYGPVVGPERRAVGWRRTFAEAKQAAADLIAMVRS